MEQKAVELVILTESSKTNGYCVSGINVQDGSWVRLVTDDESVDHSLKKENMEYEDGSIARVLDHVSVIVLDKKSTEYQPENIQIDPGYYWSKIGRMNLQEVIDLHPCDKPRAIFGNTQEDANPDDILRLKRSLQLVQVDDLEVYYVVRKGANKVKSRFLYNGSLNEDYSMTDPEFKPAERHGKIGKCIIVVSVPSEGYNGRFYKFVAKIFPLKA